MFIAGLPVYAPGISQIGAPVVGGTAGSVLFVGAGGTLAQDNANFFWDDTNNRLGIGSASPGAPLFVSGSISPVANANATIVSFSGTIVEAASGVHAQLATLAVAPATVTAGVATVTDTATVYIQDAMTATVTGANYALWVDAGNVRADGVILGSNGAVGAPSYSFTNDTDTGLYIAAAGDFRLAINGVDRVRFLTESYFTGSVVFSDIRAGNTGGTAVTTDITMNGGRTFAIVGDPQTTGSPNAFSISGRAHTTLTASAEASDVLWSLNRVVQFATGALTNQRAVRILAPTYAFVGASTITNAATLYIDNAPVAGTNATITNRYALWVDAGLARFDGDGTNIFEIDADATAPGAAAGRIPFLDTSSGSTRYIMVSNT